MKQWIVLSLLVLPLLGEAGGFQVNTQGQKAVSLGGSVTGLALDASVCYFNPGGLTLLNSNTLNAGFSLLMPKTTFLGATGSSENNASKLYTPFYVYGAYKVNEKISLGLSVNTPFQITSKWDEKWSGRYIVTESRLNTIFIQPTIAFKLTDKISLGAAPVLAIGNTFHKNALPYRVEGGNEASMELQGNGNGFGFNAGVFVSLDKLSLGVNYRSNVEIDFKEGDATFMDVPSSLISMGMYPASTTFNSTVQLPGVTTLGAAYRFNEKIQGTLDISYTGWEVYDSVIYEFENYADLNVRSEKKYENTFAFRLGMLYSYSESLELRAGLAYDQSPVPDKYVSPEVPDADKTILAFGASYKLKKGWSLEASFMFEEVKERKEAGNETYNFNGTYKSMNYVAGLGVQYAF